MAKVHKILFLFFVLLTTISCTSIHEAQHTLNVADSLRTEGIAYADSAKLSQAVSTLSKVKYFYPNDYARANYYYGRLLREEGSMPKAMQCFIDASHTDPATPIYKRIGNKYRNMTADDYNLLGRVYSNMGTICHLADEFDLSYQMYEQSAEQFKKANNVTAYYYALNDMALELAGQRDTQGTYALLNSIRIECADTIIIAKTWETEAWLLFNIEKYDSALIAVNRLQHLGNNESTGYVIKARAFWYKEQYDSALFYAKYIVDNIEIPDNYKYDMLFILAYNDDSIDRYTIKQITTERADINNDSLSPQKQQLAVAIEKLKQNFNKTKYYINIILLSACLVIMLLVVYWSIMHIKKLHKQSIESISIEQKLATQEIRRQQEQTYLQTLVEQQKQAELRQQQHLISQQIDNYNQQARLRQQQMLDNIELQCDAIRHSHNWQKEIHWKDFGDLCCFINEHFALFADKLKATELLDEKEIRLCILILLDFPISNDEQAETIIYSKTGFGKFKYRMTQKLGTTAKELREFLLKIIVSGTVFGN